MGNIKVSFSPGGPLQAYWWGEGVVGYFWDSEEGETESSVPEMCRIASNRQFPNWKAPKCPIIDNSVGFNLSQSSDFKLLSPLRLSLQYLGSRGKQHSHHKASGSAGLKEPKCQQEKWLKVSLEY